MRSSSCTGRRAASAGTRRSCSLYCRGCLPGRRGGAVHRPPPRGPRSAALDGGGRRRAPPGRAVVLPAAPTRPLRGLAGLGAAAAAGLPGPSWSTPRRSRCPPRAPGAARGDRARRRAGALSRDLPRRGRRFHRPGWPAAARRADAGPHRQRRRPPDEIAAHSPIPAGPDPGGPQRRGAARRRRRTAGAELLGARGLAGRPYVLWVGSLEPRKGVGTLVAAMARLRRRSRAGCDDWSLAGYPGLAGRRPGRRRPTGPPSAPTCTSWGR